MPLMEVSLMPGVDDTTKENLMRELTSVAVEQLSVPPETVLVILREEGVANWARGGKTKPQIERERRAKEDGA